MPTAQELVDYLTRENAELSHRHKARRGFSEAGARVAALRFLDHHRAVSSGAVGVCRPGSLAECDLVDAAWSDYRDLLPRQGETPPPEAVQFAILGTIALWLAQAFVGWAVRHLIERYTHTVATGSR